LAQYFACSHGGEGEGCHSAGAPAGASSTAHSVQNPEDAATFVFPPSEG
jgi:hypothetical protein